MESLFYRAEIFYKKYERRFASLALIAGFIFDSFTLQRIDLLMENLIILSYLMISGGSIILVNYYKEHPPQKPLFVKAEDFLPLFIQFAFGGLFSAFFIFYTRSADFLSSWPFMLILLFLLVGNEFFRERYQKPAFQASVYFVAVFSFAIFFLPVLFKAMGPAVFLLSGAVSLLFIYIFSRVLFKVVPYRYQEGKKKLWHAILSIFVVINVLYFSNLIPPIPLALKDAGIYYSIERTAGNYLVTGEKKEWYERLVFFSPEIVAWELGRSLHFFSSVFAPTDLNTKIVHDWQYFDENAGGWVSVTRIAFPIRGGRDGGYRGFSSKSNLFEGRWRVDVATERGQIIGRLRFDLEARPTPAELEMRIL